MEEENQIEIQETEGIGKIKIDGTELKQVSEYEIKRNIDSVCLTIKLSVSPKNLKTVKVLDKSIDIKIDGTKVK